MREYLELAEACLLGATVLLLPPATGHVLFFGRTVGYQNGGYKMKDESIAHPKARAVGRRDLIKAGVGAVVTAMQAPSAIGQELPTQAVPTSRVASIGDAVATGARSSGNGPMDDTTRRLVSYAYSFSESNLTDQIVDAFDNTMLDSIAALITGFESEPARICVRMARSTRSDLKSTVLGYGVITTPELAAYANTSMVRHTDFNDHESDMIPGVLAIGEALHLSGAQVMIGIVLAYQINHALSVAAGDYQRRGWDQGLGVGAATALACGKLLGLNEDQLANALSLSIVPNVPMRVARTGVLSMSKGCATAAAVRNAVFSALIAREGMTGPAQPFEGRDGLWQLATGPFKELLLPPRKPGATLASSKRFPTEGYTQPLMPVIPEVRAWTGVDEIESIHVEMSHLGVLEIAEPVKWDPRNRENADHSMPFTLAVALIDGEVSPSSFSPRRFLYDSAVHQLMQKITVVENPNFGIRQSRLTVRKKSGGELVKEAVEAKPMSREEIHAKFDRVCEGLVSDDVRDRARAAWSNLRAARDVADPISTLAAFRPG
jgi:2-methylcitrate dehydratase